MKQEQYEKINKLFTQREALNKLIEKNSFIKNPIIPSTSSVKNSRLEDFIHDIYIINFELSYNFANFKNREKYQKLLLINHKLLKNIIYNELIYVNNEIEKL